MLVRWGAEVANDTILSSDSLLRGYRSSARALLITILRSVAFPRGGPVWTATLIRSLGLCGIEEGNARQAIARIAERGMLRSEKVGAKTRWHITDKGEGQLDTAQSRAAAFGVVQQEWDGRWLVVVCPISEEQREKRRLFRSHLAFRGFGFVGGSMAVSPHVEREAILNGVLREFDLEDTAMVFRATTGEVLNDGELLQRGWDLEALASEYAEFVSEFERGTEAGDEQAFAAFVALEHAWFHLVFLDPEMPSSLLPSPWIGERAKKLYDRKEAELRSQARQWFDCFDGLIA